MLDVDWNNPGITNMTQSTVWVTGSWGVELPWIGMETEGCQFLDQGAGCRQDAKVGGVRGKYKNYCFEFLGQA